MFVWGLSPWIDIGVSWVMGAASEHWIVLMQSRGGAHWTCDVLMLSKSEADTGDSEELVYWPWYAEIKTTNQNLLYLCINQSESSITDLQLGWWSEEDSQSLRLTPTSAPSLECGQVLGWSKWTLSYSDQTRDQPHHSTSSSDWELKQYQPIRIKYCLVSTNQNHVLFVFNQSESSIYYWPDVICWPRRPLME